MSPNKEALIQRQKLSSPRQHRPAQQNDDFESQEFSSGNGASAAWLSDQNLVEPTSILNQVALTTGMQSAPSMHLGSNMAAANNAAGMSQAGEIHFHEAFVSGDGKVPAGLVEEECIHAAQQEMGGAGTRAEAERQAKSGLQDNMDLVGMSDQMALFQTLEEGFEEHFEEAPDQTDEQVQDTSMNGGGGGDGGGGTDDSGGEPVRVDATHSAEGSKVTDTVTEVQTVDEHGGAVVSDITATTIDISKGHVSYSSTQVTMTPTERTDAEAKAATAKELKLNIQSVDAQIAEWEADVAAIQTTRTTVSGGMESDAGAAAEVEHAEVEVESDAASTPDASTSADSGTSSSAPASSEVEVSGATDEETLQTLQRDEDALVQAIEDARRVKEGLEETARQLEAGEIEYAEVLEQEGMELEEATEEEKEGYSLSLGLDGATYKATDGPLSAEAQVNTSGASLTTETEGEGKEKDTVKAGVNLDEGVAVEGSSERVAEDGSSTSTEGNVAGTFDEDGSLTGVSGSGERTVKDEDGNISSSTEVRGTASTDEVAIGATTTRGQDTMNEGEGKTLTVSLGGDAGIKVDVNPVSDDPNISAADQTYVLTATIYAKGEVGGTAGAADKDADRGNVSGSATLTAGGGFSATYTHTMNAEEAGPYLAELEPGQSDALPEFSEVGEIRKWIEQVQSGAPVISLDAEGAAGLVEGDTFNTTRNIEAKLAVKASWSFLSGGFTVGGSATSAFDVASADGKVTATRAYKTDATVGADGKVTLGLGVSGSASTSTTESVGATATFTLDPNAAGFSEAFTAIEGCSGVEALMAVAEQYGGAISVQSGESLTNKTSVGLGSVQVVGTETSELSEDIHADGTGSSVTGGNSQSMAVQVGEQTVAEDKTAESATAKVTEDGVTVDASQTDTSRGAEGSTEDLGKNAVTEGLPSALTEALTEAEVTLRNVSIEPSEMTTMVARAGDTEFWNSCTNVGTDVAATVPSMEAWYAFGGALRGTAPDTEFAETHPNEAIWLAQARAVGSFFASADGVAYEYWYLGLRGGGAARLGEQTVWPAGTTEMKKAYEGVEARVGSFPKDITPLAPVLDYEGEQALYDQLRADTAAVRDQILASTAWQDDLAAQSEMANRCNEWLARILEAHQMFSELAYEYETSDSSEDVDGTSLEEEFPTSDVSEDEVLESETCPPIDEAQLAAAEEQIANRLELMGSNKAVEQAMLAELQAYMNDAQSFSATMDDLKDFYGEWVGQVKDLRGVYLENEFLPGSWAVSADGKEARSVAYEPDVEALIALYMEWQTHTTSPGAHADELRRLYGQY